MILLDVFPAEPQAMRRSHAEADFVTGGAGFDAIPLVSIEVGEVVHG